MDISLRNDLLTLLRTQEAFVILEEFMAKKDDVSNKLSDVWNVMLELRGCLLEKIIENDRFKASGLPDALLESTFKKSAAKAFVPF